MVILHHSGVIFWILDVLPYNLKAYAVVDTGHPNFVLFDNSLQLELKRTI